MEKEKGEKKIKTTDVYSTQNLYEAAYLCVKGLSPEKFKEFGGKVRVIFSDKKLAEKFSEEFRNGEKLNIKDYVDAYKAVKAEIFDNNRPAENKN